MAALLADAHFWIALALVVFLLVLWRAGIHTTVGRTLDDAGARVQAQLDEAARLRAEAADLLAQIKRQHVETEKAAAEMMKAAAADTERLRAETQTALAEDLRRRRDLAQRRIATAEAQAAAQVKSAAADVAAEMSRSMLAQRIAGATSDPLIDVGLAQLGERLS